MNKVIAVIAFIVMILTMVCIVVGDGNITTQLLMIGIQIVCSVSIVVARINDLEASLK